MKLVVSLLVLTGCVKDKENQDLSLANTAMAIDPGHGGLDGGTWRVAPWDSAKIIVEHAYTQDIALRLARWVSEMGGVAVLTVRGDSVIHNFPPDSILITDRQESIVGSLDSVADGSTSSLTDRNVAGQRFNSSFSDRDRSWTSVHIDNLPPKIHTVKGKITVDTICGVRIIYAKGAEDYARSLAKIFDRLHVLRAKDPVVINGSPVIDERLHVLHIADNPIRQKVLVELGNIKCNSDLAKVLDPVWRERYAFAIALAMADLHKSHISP